MPVLDGASRQAVSKDYQADASTTRTGLTGVTDDDIRAAVDAADVWTDANAASFNSALPLAARNGLSQKQKAQLLLFVVRRRYEVQ